MNNKYRIGDFEKMYETLEARNSNLDSNKLPEQKEKPLPHSEEYWEGFDRACEILDENYAKSHPHKYNIADCVRAKVNRLPKNKIRKNKI